MPLFDHLFSVGAFRKAIWALWYPFLTRRLRGEDILFLNYAFETAPPLDLPLSAQDEPNRACIQLYHHVATQVALRGKTVLEVSCGHGGGASYLTRTEQPKAYTGLDLNSTGIQFCTRRHSVDGLTFIRGDAGSLPFPSETFDVVVNVEASHCYPHFSQFLSEVARVLQSGGHFLYADFRFNEDISEWEKNLARAPFERLKIREINAEVLRGMDRNAERSRKLIVRLLPRFLQALGRDFAGIPGSRVYDALQQERLSYRSYCFVKSKASD